jgi:hypothetical protein
LFTNGRKGLIIEEEFPDGFYEIIKYSEKSHNNIKSIFYEVLTEKAKKKEY